MCKCWLFICVSNDVMTSIHNFSPFNWMGAVQCAYVLVVADVFSLCSCILRVRCLLHDATRFRVYVSVKFTKLRHSKHLNSNKLLWNRMFAWAKYRVQPLFLYLSCCAIVCVFFFSFSLLFLSLSLFPSLFGHWQSIHWNCRRDLI